MLLNRTPDGIEEASFEAGFSLDTKALVSSNDDGSLTIEGLASDFDVDRQDEAFEPGAFNESLSRYLSHNPVLLYHHKKDMALGRVTAANIDSNGLHVKAIVDAPEPGTPAADLYRKVKSGTLRGFSVGGRFFRRMTEKGPRIFKCDLTEISITPQPVNSNALFAVAGKAFETGLESVTITDGPNVPADWERRLALIAQNLNEAGKAMGTTPQSGQSAAVKIHPDAHRIGLLLAHQQKIVTLANDVHQNANDPEVQKVAAKAAKAAAKHSKDLHSIAAKIGPLPDYYGGLA